MWGVLKVKLSFVALYCAVIFCSGMLNFYSTQAQFLSSYDKKKKLLPDFSYLTMEGKIFTNENLNKNSRLLIVYFNPLCEVCQRETSDIIDNINYFQDIQILMISPARKEDISRFIEKNKLNEYHQMTVLYDKEDYFYKQFGARGYPTLYLYNKKKELIENFDTEVSFEEIKNSFGAEEVASDK